MSGNSTADDHRAYWRSRRGMLELDLVLVPFARDVYPSLAAADKRHYRRLLERDDWVIWEWLEARSRPDDDGLAGIVERILACR